MNEETINTELQKYNITDAALAKLNADYEASTLFVEIQDILQTATDEMRKKVVEL